MFSKLYITLFTFSLFLALVRVHKHHHYYDGTINNFGADWQIKIFALPNVSSFTSIADEEDLTGMLILYVIQAWGPVHVKVFK